MSRQLGARILWLSLVLAARAVAGEAAVTPRTDLDKTNRVIKGLPINLAPLAAWFHDKKAGKAVLDEDRPLTAWKLVRLEKVTETGTTWVVEAQVEGKPATIFLKNPPQKEFEEFNRLKVQHDQLLTATNRMAADLQRLPGIRRDLEARERELSRHRGTRLEAAALHRRAADLAFQERALRQQLDAARENLRRFDARGYDLKKPFTMECLAMRTGEMALGKPVFDRGFVK